MYKYVDVNSIANVRPDNGITKALILDAMVCVHLKNAGRRRASGNYTASTKLNELIARSENGYQIFPSYGIYELATKGGREPLDEQYALELLGYVRDILEIHPDQVVGSIDTIKEVDIFYKDSIPEVNLRLLLIAFIMSETPGGKIKVLDRITKYIEYHLENNLKSISMLHDLALNIFARQNGYESFIQNDNKSVVDSVKSSTLDIIHARFSFDLLQVLMNTRSVAPQIYFVTDESRLYSLASRMLIPAVEWSENDQRATLALVGIERPDYLKDDVWESIKYKLAELENSRQIATQQARNANHGVMPFRPTDFAQIQPLIEDLEKRLR